VSDRVRIEVLPYLHPVDLDGCDFSFDVTCVALPPFSGTGIERVAPISPYCKTYPLDPELFTVGEGADRRLAVAEQGGRVVGVVLVSKAWNGYASVDMLAVDRPSRGRGIGRRLLDEAVRWAVANALPGLCLETQSNNVAACRLYERYGFTLGGFDRYLYDALGLPDRETALYWYLFLDTGHSDAGR
jgi:GNAT superfamily N-acetyltransferase